MRREVLLAQTFVELADTLADEFDIIDLMTMLAGRTVEILEAAAAGIMVADHDGRLHVVASSSEQVRVLELFQLQNSEGPCFDCYVTGEPVVNEDLTHSQRWPHFGPAAVAAGFRTVQAMPLRLRGTRIGTLNIFVKDRIVMGDDDLVVAKALADAATIAILNEQAAREAKAVTSQLKIALSTRVAIEQAKGVLAERAKIDMDEAFFRLRRYARSHNRRLGVVANEVVIGTLPAEALGELVSQRGGS